jgi:hypothetical protein
LVSVWLASTSEQLLFGFVLSVFPLPSSHTIAIGIWILMDLFRLYNRALYVFICGIQVAFGVGDLYEITNETIDFFGLFSVYRPLDFFISVAICCIPQAAFWCKRLASIVLEQLSFGFVVSAFFTISYPIAISIWIQWIRTICSFLTITCMHLSQCGT